MFFQMKAIRKGRKPPIWRRAYIPSNITFAQLALMLETVLEYDASDMYEFEFYHKKDRIIEWHERDRDTGDFYYSYLNAPDTYINEWLMDKSWFTFRLRNEQTNVPEYRVEIEKVLESIKIRQGDEDRELNYPIILKEVSLQNGELWSDAKVINEVLKHKYFTRKADPDYRNISELRACVEEGRGIAACDKMVNRDIHTKKSADATIKEFADQVLKKATAQSTSENQAYSQFVNTKRKASMEGNLNAYTKQDLCEIAQELGLKLKAVRKDKITYELARYLLEPQTMREQLLQMDDSELEAFEKAMEKGCFLPSQAEFEQLENAYDLNYISCYTDDRMEVPEEVIFVYGVIKKNGYREFHKKARWLLKCLEAFDLIHLAAPHKILYRMYRQNKNVDADYEDFMSVLEKLPDSLLPCKRIGDKLVSKEILKNELYKGIEARQRDVDYYIPNVNEIMSYAEDGYPSCEEAYAALYDFYHKDMHVDDEQCKYLCRQAFGVFFSGRKFPDYMEIVNESNIVFDSDRQAGKFAALAMQVNNHTRMFELKGHKPLEIRNGLVGGKMPVIVPMSGEAAQMLEAGRNQLVSMGIDIDTERTASNIPAFKYPDSFNGTVETSVKKVYPNDPCPCGSGKKYKKCCGRK